MTTSVEDHGAVARRAQDLTGALPCVTRLTTAVLQHHQRPIGITPRITSQLNATGTRPMVHGLGGQRKTCACTHEGILPGQRARRRILSRHSLGSPAWPQQVPSVAGDVDEHDHAAVVLVAWFGHELDAVIEHPLPGSLEVIDA